MSNRKYTEDQQTDLYRTATWEQVQALKFELKQARTAQAKASRKMHTQGGSEATKGWMDALEYKTNISTTYGIALMGYQNRQKAARGY